ncbi:DNA recombination protein RmuC [hydrothermal vent metagenome]|uniref:DNA recombination protein RmuC n=1 Tax=hydrothermal vent metagenome TaxID=652676 RepID=A0A3B0YAV6_9ZZZZ
MTPFMSPVIISIILAAASLSAFLTWFLIHIRNLKIVTAYKSKIHHLQTTLDLERENFKQQTNAQQQLAHVFSTLSSEALRNNNDTFLQLAQENLKQFQIKAETTLDTKEKAIENLLKPIHDALHKTEQQIHEIENDRKQSFGALNQHLESLAKAHEQLQGETRNLVTALRRPEVRGKWGELTLKRVVELAGMIDRCDFFEQPASHSDQGLLRPDMIVRLPNEREIIVDAKTPLDAYLNAIEASDDATQQAELTRHAKNVRARIKELASKAYWHQFKQAPDFVVMFIPGEQFLSAATDIDRDLIEYALKQKIIISTPTTLVALLRAVAYGWRQQSLEKNAEQIKQLGEELYTRVAKFTEHLTNIGKSLGKTVEHYNMSIGTLERQIIPCARKMEELGIEADKSPELADQIETNVREIQAELPSKHKSDSSQATDSHSTTAVKKSNTIDDGKKTSNEANKSHPQLSDS